MLSDACFEFFDRFEHAAQKLAEAVHWYSSPDSGIVYGEEIDALRHSCVRVRSDPQDFEARTNLLRLATSVMRFHDTPPSIDESVSREADVQRRCATSCLSWPEPTRNMAGSSVDQ